MANQTAVRPQKPPVRSFLILVDYPDVLSLRKVDPVYKLYLSFVDFRVLYLGFVYLPSLIPVKD